MYILLYATIFLFDTRCYNDATDLVKPDDLGS